MQAALVPGLSAAAVFLCGAVLLASGVLPASAGRLAWLHKFLTVPVIENKDEEQSANPDLLET